MRVLHLSSGNMFGGVETLLLTLARHADAAPAMEPHFGFVFEGRIAAEIRAVGRPVHLMGEVRLRDPLSVRRARLALGELARRQRFDLVVCHGYWPVVIFGPATRRAGLPLVFWLHDLPDGKHWLQRLARRVAPDLVLCNSRFTAGLAPRLYPVARREVVYYPVEQRGGGTDGGERVEVRAETGTPDDAVVIAQVSRMEAWKGHELLLRALGQLRDVPGWVCWEVGGAQRPAEAAYRAGMERLAAELGIAERVRFLGQRADVPRLLRAADVHCQPNTGPEPFGITFVEGLQAGLPVVTTALGGALEIVDTGCGMLTEPGDAAALGEALARLVRDPALRARLGSAGPARAAELCAPDRQIPRLLDLFSTLAPNVGNG